MNSLLLHNFRYITLPPPPFTAIALETGAIHDTHSQVHSQCDDGKELREWRNPLCLAPRRKHIMCEMEFVVLLLIVRSKEGLRVTPRTLYSISVIPGVRIDEQDRVIHGAVRVTVRPDIMVRSPAVTDERCAGFDPCKDDARQCVGGSVRNGNKKCSTCVRGHITTARVTLHLTAN